MTMLLLFFLSESVLNPVLAITQVCVPVPVVDSLRLSITGTKKNGTLLSVPLFVHR
jgi:TRAP-type mannitol/chloroaromatic compound transport system permease large subunit|tara:strand:+ start:18217 stop:18384 length:168 start_codon:yes stop_codon:yes gene_type:complete